MCVDYREFNKIRTRNSFPLQRIDDLLNKLQGTTVFSSLVLLDAYHQIRMPEYEITKTPFGLYKMHVMTFGLNNAPSTFMIHMNAMSQGLPFVVVFLDDIIIFSKTFKEYTSHVQQVLARITKYSCK
jgi:hypothetical protein